jgi:hypothetical protein
MTVPPEQPERLEVVLPEYEYQPSQPAISKQTLIALAAIGFAIVALVVAIAIAVSRDRTPRQEQGQSQTEAGAKTNSGRPGGVAEGAKPASGRQTGSASDAGSSLSLATVFLCAFAIFCIAYLVGTILLMAWVAKDCRARGVDGGALWVMIIFFTGFVGLLVYLASRPFGTLVICHRCGNKRLMAAVICPHCGGRTEEL